MNLKNESYFVTFQFRSGKVEQYWKDALGWHKTSMAGRILDMSAEQVLNHLLPAVADVKKRGIVVRVDHYEDPGERPVPRSDSDARRPSSAAFRGRARTLTGRTTRPRRNP